MYIIKGSSRFGTEDIDSADTREEAIYLLNEYQLAYGRGWRLWIARRR